MRERGRKRERDEGTEGLRDGVKGREGGRKEGSEGGSNEWREGGMEGGRSGRREGGRVPEGWNLSIVGRMVWVH